jgi:hypothetical protein
MNGIDRLRQCIVLGHLWKKDASIGSRVPVLSPYPVHGYCAEHL